MSDAPVTNAALDTKLQSFRWEARFWFTAALVVGSQGSAIVGWARFW